MAFHTFFSRTVDKKKSAMRYHIGTKSGERSKTGFEVEFLMVDGDGRVSNEADRVLSHIKKKKLKHEAVKECCHSYIEMGVYPRIYVRNVAMRFLGDMLGVLDVAEKYGLGFYPLSMYPYRYTPKMRGEGWYGVKGRIFGEKWEYAGRCAGFHFHYSLPSGIFSYDKRELLKGAQRSEKQKTINSYNFGIAIDPVLTTLTQSSPVFQGRYLAKDSRLLLYRGGNSLGYDGMYSGYQPFGSLQPYVITYGELIERTDKRYDRWLEIVKKAGGDVDEVEKKNKLDFSWNPVKINKVGSIELRGMDMNLPSVLIAVGILAKYALRDIQRQEIEVIPDNRAIERPFEFENEEKGKIYVPPFWYVNTILQHEAAWEGLESDAVYDYCRAFFRLCLRFTNKKYHPALKPVKEMIKSRATVSDDLLSRLGKMGYGRDETVPEDALREIVLHYSGGLRRDITGTKELMGSLSEGGRGWL